MEFRFQKVVAALNETFNDKERLICMFCDFFCECRDCFYPISREKLRFSPRLRTVGCYIISCFGCILKRTNLFAGFYF